MNRISTIAMAAALGLTVATSAKAWTGYGNDTLGPEVFLTYNGTSISVSVASPDQGPYDGVEDTYIGVINNSSKTLNSINLNGGTQSIFGFDGDGIDTYGSPGNAMDTTGYGGPQGYFTGIVGNTGTINFIGGVPAGGTTYFSLEEPIASAIGSGSGGGLTGGVPDAGSTMALLGSALVGLGALRRRFNA